MHTTHKTFENNTHNGSGSSVFCNLHRPPPPPPPPTPTVALALMSVEITPISRVERHMWHEIQHTHTHTHILCGSACRCLEPTSVCIIFVSGLRALQKTHTLLPPKNTHSAATQTYTLARTFMCHHHFCDAPMCAAACVARFQWVCSVCGTRRS